jgi:hypothetical protein
VHVSIHLSAPESARKAANLDDCDTSTMGKPDGFSFVRRKSGEIVVMHRGRQAAVLRGRQADKFIDRLDRHDPQELMARITGDYKHGNERRH